MPYMNMQPQQQFAAPVNAQRNAIAAAMMNIARPPPQVGPRMPQSRALMGTPQLQPPGAPPQGTPTPGMPMPTMPLSLGAPPNPAAMTGMMPQQPQLPQQPGPGT